ncbi:prepilin-type N-terminal cleavage/methylation domain-containing protein [Tissierella praeacuta]|uniref:PilW family protein n=1 Tax=Tissierella praeacuta TaxID=43131 RepID=UPI002FD8E03E
MWNIKGTYLQNKGFTLIEIILSLTICSLIILPLFSILKFSMDACTIGDEKDELMLNGRYAIEYIKEEVKSADKIILSDKIEGLKKKFPTNIGFVIMIIDDDNGYNPYKYSTYHMKNNKIIRLACNLKNNKYPSYIKFDGYNELCGFVDNIGDTTVDIENSIISLHLKFKHNHEKLELKSDIYIRCPID